MRPNPLEDGITHINVYSKGATEIGRFLSNFCRWPILTPDGKFDSVEGYWYWLGTHDERFRTASGWPAKSLGRLVPRTIKLPPAEFRERICFAITQKLLTAPRHIKEALKNNKLPYVHYYVWGTDGYKDMTHSSQFMLDHIKESIDA